MVSRAPGPMMLMEPRPRRHRQWGSFRARRGEVGEWLSPQRPHAASASPASEAARADPGDSADPAPGNETGVPPVLQPGAQRGVGGRCGPSPRLDLVDPFDDDPLVHPAHQLLVRLILLTITARARCPSHHRESLHPAAGQSLEHVGRLGLAGQTLGDQRKVRHRGCGAGTVPDVALSSQRRAPTTCAAVTQPSSSRTSSARTVTTGRADRPCRLNELAPHAATSWPRPWRAGPP